MREKTNTLLVDRLLYAKLNVYLHELIIKINNEIMGKDYYFDITFNPNSSLPTISIGLYNKYTPIVEYYISKNKYTNETISIRQSKSKLYEEFMKQINLKIKQSPLHNIKKLLVLFRDKDNPTNEPEYDIHVNNISSFVRNIKFQDIVDKF